jgi:hypothetical protein
LQPWETVEEFLYDTDKEKFRVRRIELRYDKEYYFTEVKSEMLFVDYRNSGIDFHGCLKILHDFSDSW